MYMYQGKTRQGTMFFWLSAQPSEPVKEFGKAHGAPNEHISISYKHPTNHSVWYPRYTWTGLVTTGSMTVAITHLSFH